MKLEDAMKKIEAILSSVYDEGFSDGSTKQAILEIRGRDKFIVNFKKESEQREG